MPEPGGHDSTGAPGGGAYAAGVRRRRIEFRAVTKSARTRLSGAYPRLSLVAAAALFSTGGAAIKASSWNAFQVASFRSLVAAIAVALVIPGARRGWTRRTWVAAAAYGATMISFVLATKLTTSANAIFLQSTAPLYLLLLGPLLLDEKFVARDLAFIAAMGLGLALFFLDANEATAIAANPRLGNLLALGSGICWALTLVAFRWLERRESGAYRESSPQSALVGGNVIAFLACLPFALPAPAFTAADVGTILYLGLVQIGLAYLFFIRGIRRVPALEASLLLLLEPVLNPVWAWLVHGERPGRWALLGAAILLATIALRSALTSRGPTVAAASASPD
jgi:drug/metabolite transporter (DMT)-like permease